MMSTFIIIIIHDSNDFIASVLSFKSERFQIITHTHNFMSWLFL